MYMFQVHVPTYPDSQPMIFSSEAYELEQAKRDLEFVGFKSKPVEAPLQPTAGHIFESKDNAQIVLLDYVFQFLEKPKWQLRSTFALNQAPNGRTSHIVYVFIKD